MNCQKHYKHKFLRLYKEFIKKQTGINQLKKERDNLRLEVEKYRKAFEDAKKERDCQITEYQNKIEELESHYKFFMMQIDDVLVKFLGGTHKAMDNPNDFEKIIQEVIDKSKTVSNFLPTEPIKVADMLINTSGECEPLIIEGTEFKDTYKIFQIKDLKQIAQYLLIYCEYNE